jgi:hypothetical protein
MAEGGRRGKRLRQLILISPEVTSVLCEINETLIDIEDASPSSNNHFQ